MAEHPSTNEGIPRDREKIVWNRRTERTSDRFSSSNLRSSWHSVTLDRTRRIPVKVSMMRVPTAAFFSRSSRLIPVMTLRVSQRPSTPSGTRTLLTRKRDQDMATRMAEATTSRTELVTNAIGTSTRIPWTSTMSLLSRATISPTRVRPKKRISARSR